jgi:hypothetical protein
MEKILKQNHIYLNFKRSLENLKSKYKHIKLKIQNLLKKYND